jgi:hypothetical protein
MNDDYDQIQAEFNPKLSSLTKDSELKEAEVWKTTPASRCRRS